MIRISFYHNHAFHHRINYVLQFIENHPLARGQVKFYEGESSESTISLSYGGDGGADYYIPAQQLVFTERSPRPENLKYGIYMFNDLEVFSVEKNPGKTHSFVNDRFFAFDWIETIFFHISRYEEWFYLEGREDAFGRMNEEMQFLVRYKLHKIPVVDRLVEASLRALGIEPGLQTTIYSVSHDIDFLIRHNSIAHVLKSMAGALLKRRDPASAARIWALRHQANPYDTFDWLLLEDTDIKKSIYFLVGGKSKYDSPYGLDLPEVKKAIAISKDRGYAIGIHPSFESWKDVRMLLKEKQKLEEVIGREVKITRQHFLRFSFPETASILEKLGFKEDASMGYAERIGFRCGTGFPYKLYNFEEEKAYTFLEFPLVFMDSALFYESGHDPQKFEDLWRDFLLQNKENTQITFNFHNSRFFDAFLYDLPLKRLYKELFTIEDI